VPFGAFVGLELKGVAAPSEGDIFGGLSRLLDFIGSGPNFPVVSWLS
jgi:hypothetical protein